MVFGRSKEESMKETYARGQPLISGETVTGGRFACTECGFDLDREPGVVTNLPVCPNCQNDRWKPR